MDWSFTRASLYHSCPRAFFYSAAPYRSQAPGDEQLVGQKMLNLSSLVGIAVHKSIAGQVSRWRDGCQLDVREARAQAISWIQNTWQERHRTIIEVSNGQEVEDSIVPKLTHAASMRIRTFFLAVWPQFARHTYVSHEALRSFPLNQRRVWVRVDLCSRSADGSLVVSDWKTGKSPVSQAEHLQLGTYALWGSHEYSVRPEDIVVQIADLRTGEVIARQLKPGQLDRVVNEVARYVELWDSDRENDYPADPDAGKCYSCKSLKLCAAGQEAVRSSA